MPNLRISSLEGRPLLDLSSYARRGPGQRDRLSSEEIAHIGRTVRRTPEVMVKVLSKDSNNLRSVAPTASTFKGGAPVSNWSKTGISTWIRTGGTRSYRLGPV